MPCFFIHTCAAHMQRCTVACCTNSPMMQLIGKQWHGNKVCYCFKLPGTPSAHGALKDVPLCIHTADMHDRRFRPSALSALMKLVLLLSSARCNKITCRSFVMSLVIHPSWSTLTASRFSYAPLPFLMGGSGQSM